MRLVVVAAVRPFVRGSDKAVRWPDTPDKRACFDSWLSTMLQVERSPTGAAAITTLLTYMFRVVDPVYWEDLRAKIHQLGRRAEESAMTIAEWLHEEGRKVGLEQGRVTTLRGLLLFKFKLAKLDEAYEARLRDATPAQLDRFLHRVLVASSLAAVFED
jgi:hypothetical protein